MKNYLVFDHSSKNVQYIILLWSILLLLFVYFSNSEYSYFKNEYSLFQVNYQDKRKYYFILLKFYSYDTICFNLIYLLQYSH
jgi:hypothetical protein